MDCYRAAAPITIPTHGAVVDRSVGIGPDQLAQISGGGSEAIVLVVATLVVASGSLALWRRASDDSAAPGDVGSDDASVLDAEDTAPEPRNDQDVVRSILESHGGRARQSIIVDETDWSKAKVSAVLAEMHENDAVSKLRVGRENIVSLPGHEPDAVGSPIEE